MKSLAVIGFLCASLLFIACGDSTSKQPEAPPTKVKASSAPPNVWVPSGPPPKNVVVKELKEGSGATIKSGQGFSADYVTVGYKTKEPLGVRWNKSVSISSHFDTGELVEGWEVGLKGMRVGGRRELIVPSKLAYGDGALIYVIELLETSK